MQRLLWAVRTSLTGPSKPYKRADSIMVHRSRLYGAVAAHRHPDEALAAELVAPSAQGQYRLQLQRADSLALTRRSLAAARRARSAAAGTGAQAHGARKSSFSRASSAGVAMARRVVSWADERRAN